MINQTCPTEKEALHNADIHFAVFNGSEDITPKIYEEVKNFANFIAQREANKKNVSE